MIQLLICLGVYCEKREEVDSKKKLELLHELLVRQLHYMDDW
jgi:hypothetical protein